MDTRRPKTPAIFELTVPFKPTGERLILRVDDPRGEAVASFAAALDQIEADSQAEQHRQLCALEDRCFVAHFELDDFLARAFAYDRPTVTTTWSGDALVHLQFLVESRIYIGGQPRTAMFGFLERVPLAARGKGYRRACHVLLVQSTPLDAEGEPRAPVYGYIEDWNARSRTMFVDARTPEGAAIVAQPDSFTPPYSYGGHELLLMDCAALRTTFEGEGLELERLPAGRADAALRGFFDRFDATPVEPLAELEAGGESWRGVWRARFESGWELMVTLHELSHVTLHVEDASVADKVVLCGNLMVWRDGEPVRACRDPGLTARVRALLSSVATSLCGSYLVFDVDQFSGESFLPTLREHEATRGVSMELYNCVPRDLRGDLFDPAPQPARFLDPRHTSSLLYFDAPA